MVNVSRPAALVAALALLLASPASAGPAAIGGGLPQLLAAWDMGSPILPAALATHLTDGQGAPLVKVRMQDGATVEQVLPGLEASGFKLTAVSAIDARLIEGYLPLYGIRSAALVPGVRSAHATRRPVRNAGLVQSQAVALQKADLAQARGVTGAGIKVGVLSDSYDACGSGCATSAADDIASGDLPAAGVTVLAEMALADQPGTDEGRAMLQLVHDVAPGATLAFATAWNGQVDYANNILALRSQFHADVIVDDVFYFEEPMFSDGILAQAVDRVAASGAAYFSSAGNNGLEAWEDDYHPVPFARAQALTAAGRGGNLKLDQIPAAIRPVSLHDFGGLGGPAFTQRFSTAASNQIAFQWDEPFFQDGVKTDYNIYVFDGAGNWMDPFSASFPGFYTTDDNLATDEPFEFLVLPPVAGEIHGGANVTDWQIVIGSVNGGPARHLKYVNANGLGVSERQAAPSIFGHAAARGGQAVAATYYAIPTSTEDFSSPGPTTIYLDSSGNRLRRPEVRAVPQLTAADGVDTTFFGFDADANGLPNFFGTSAASPNAAAVAALVLQAAGGPGSLQPQALYRVMQGTATPIPLPNDRSWAAAFAGPVVFSASGDWTRWNRYFGLDLLPIGERKVASVALDLAATPLIFSANLARVSVGDARGLTPADISLARSADGKVLTLGFAPGSFGPGDGFRFGESVFNPLQGSTQEDPDRFRGMVVKVTFENGGTAKGTVIAGTPQAVNRFAGSGLVNADAATRAVRDGHH
jgi:hypothetical protein